MRTRTTYMLDLITSYDEWTFYKITCKDEPGAENNAEELFSGHKPEADNENEFFDIIDHEIEKQLGFCPDYQLN